MGLRLRQGATSGHHRRRHRPGRRWNTAGTGRLSARPVHHPLGRRGAPARRDRAGDGGSTRRPGAAPGCLQRLPAIGDPTSPPTAALRGGTRHRCHLRRRRPRQRCLLGPLLAPHRSFRLPSDRPGSGSPPGRGRAARRPGAGIGTVITGMALAGTSYGGVGPALSSMIGPEAPRDVRARVFGMASSATPVGVTRARSAVGCLPHGWGSRPRCPCVRAWPSAWPSSWCSARASPPAEERRPGHLERMRCGCGRRSRT